MENNESYRLFIENLDDEFFRLEKKTKYNREEFLVQAMTEIRRKRNSDIIKELENNEDIDSYSDYEKALFIEAKLINLYRSGKKEEELLPLIEEALSLNPKGAISLNLLATYEFQNKNLDEAIRILLEIINLYPGAKWVYLQIVRMLYVYHDYKKAFSYTKKIESEILRFMYIFTIRVRPFYWPLLLGYALLIIVTQSIPAFLLMLIVFIIILSIAVISKEKVLIYQYRIWLLPFFFGSALYSLIF